MHAVSMKAKQKVKAPPLTDITTSAWKADPYPLYARLRAEQPVSRARFGKLPAWLITRYDDVALVLRDERFVKDVRNAQSAAQLAERPWVPSFMLPLDSNMLDQDDPNHARLRALVHKAFTPARVEKLEPRIEAVANQLLDKLLPNRSIDLMRDFALPLPLAVIADLLGIPPGDRDRFHRWSTALFRPPTALNVMRILPSIYALMRHLRKLFRLRRAEPQDDLMSALVQAEDAGDHLSEDELLAMVFLLLVAGHETTVNLIGSGTLALLQYPDQLDMLRAQPALIQPAVEELLRFTSPVESATERYASIEMAMRSQIIHKGELVLAVIASANRDEQVFTKPDVLDITREKNRHLAFGLGGHFCLGAPLARMEGQIAINLLVQRLHNLKLAVPPEKLRWRATPIVRGLEALPLTFSH